MDQRTPAGGDYCYRHPNRPTRLYCSECGRPICPECSRDAVVGQKCPECTSPGQTTRVIHARNLRPTGLRATPVTFALIIVNVIIYFGGQIFPAFEREVLQRAAQHPILVDAGEWWRLITAMFLHGSILHILFNMYALWLFGPVIERRFGSPSFASLYLATGIAGATLYQFIGPEAWAVGASGAIFGLFGALLAASYRQRHTRAGSIVFGQLMLLLAINMVIPFLPGTNIAWQAHIGGLIAGAIIGAAWDRLPLTAGSAWKRASVALALGAAAFIAVLVV